jgi:hypothetical protein
MKNYRILSTTPERDAMLALAATAVGLESSNELINASIDAMLATITADDPILRLAIARAGGADWNALESLICELYIASASKRLC